MVAAPSQSPVKVSREAKVVAVGVGGKGVGVAVAGGVVGKAQADNTTSRRRVEKIRMSINIIQRIKKVPLQLEGSIKDPSCEGSNQI
jgi:hypothetical protein